MQATLITFGPVHRHVRYAGRGAQQADINELKFPEKFMLKMREHCTVYFVWQWNGSAEWLLQNVLHYVFELSNKVVIRGMEAGAREESRSEVKKVRGGEAYA